MTRQTISDNRKVPVTRKAAVRAGRKKRSPEKHPATLRGKRICTPEDRHRMICDTAYFLAQQRGFQGNRALDDWLEAEAIVDAVNISKAVTEGKSDDG